MNKQDKVFVLRLFDLWIRYDHYERIIRNVVLVSFLFAVIIIFGIYKGIDFQFGMGLFLAIIMVLGLPLFAVAKKTDDISKKDIPGMMKELMKR
ncbi:hypothetical protein JW968_05635 [Candidatus Woesearchaeota archaeon]|nr:hypothetical protein [Candidatus Woesearchaeota archaeon]